MGAVKVDAENVVTFRFRLRLTEGIGISVINKKMQELVYCTLRGVELKYADARTNATLNLIIKWIQVTSTAVKRCPLTCLTHSLVWLARAAHSLTISCSED